MHPEIFGHIERKDVQKKKKSGNLVATINNNSFEMVTDTT